MFFSPFCRLDSSTAAAAAAAARVQDALTRYRRYRRIHVLGFASPKP